MTPSATLVDAPRIDPSSLRAIATSVEKEIHVISLSLAGAREQEETLSAERKSLVLPARSKKDREAQNRIAAIDELLAPLSRDIADDEAALSSLGNQLTALKNDIARAEWDEKRAAIVDTLATKAKQNPYRGFVAAVDELKRQIDLLSEDSKELAQIVRAFDRRLHHEAVDLAGIYRELEDIVASHLAEKMPRNVMLDSRVRRYTLDTDWELRRKKTIASVIDSVESLEMKA